MDADRHPFPPIGTTVAILECYIPPASPYLTGIPRYPTMRSD
jgi:hypothetical protein